ncbi:MAG: ferrochelatase [Actinobacteria bacterium]|nr:ferrochelatase [Actinomycetota bacterium]MCL6104908.1 ferrochelatase [Actinomycetota bacterium]
MNDASRNCAVLVLAHGSAHNLDELEDFYTSIRKGRRPSEAELEWLKKRYELIGGLSPLNEITQAQVQGLQYCLDMRNPNYYKLFFATKHAYPTIEQTVAEIVFSNFNEVVVLVLAPHYSSLTTKEYFNRVSSAFHELASPEIRPTLIFVKSYHTEEGLISLLVERVLDSLNSLPARESKGLNRVLLLFSAHSLPLDFLPLDDPYPSQVTETSQAVATKIVGISSWRLAWQSIGQNRRDKWLQPSVAEVITQSSGLFESVIVVPVGFVSDHLETLYDLDIEARKVAEQAGLNFVRTASLNADPRFLEILADVVVRRKS